MRKWTPAASASSTGRYAHVLADLIGQLGQPRFTSALLEGLNPVVPAASFSIYQTGHSCVPQLFMSGSFGVPDTTRDCWRAYLSGPYLSDQTLVHDSAGDTPLLCHITAQEVPVQHRARVYEAHGVAERVSVVQQTGASLLALNFYRHQHQRPFSDQQVAGFADMAPALLALAKKHIALSSPPPITDPLAAWQQRLRQLNPALTPRELDVCARLLTGMTQDGIASDLGLSLPSVKTYRNRAFARLGIHFRNELFALLLRSPAVPAAHHQ